MLCFLFSRMAACVLLGGLLLPACNEPVDDAIAPPKPTPPAVAVANWAARADSAQEALQKYYWAPTGQYYWQNNLGKPDYNYWWQAHGLDILLDGYQRTQKTEFLTRIKDLQQGAKAKNGNTWLNNWYDDMAWHAVANLRAFQLTQDPAYKAIALLLWDDIKTGWNEQQGGGIAWKKDQLGYKTTPSTAPSIILAARLYQLDKNPDDLAWAKKMYEWQKKTLVDANGMVWDGINDEGTSNKKYHFSYSQGVFIGAGLELYRATQQASYLDDANRTASYVLNDSQMSPGGVVGNEGGGDGGLFKGILVRYLSLLATESAVPAATRASYVSFLKFNGESLYQRGTNRSTYLFNTSWISPPGATVDGSTQMSGVMMSEVMADLQARKLL
ncbi:glycoside hydrolase family 76 protein [Hymenobacter guriensis]|uniref:Glycosyl hydrolase n=1 Tax=Hymenobacter guriensis TaxID=2793065 RepID=A0ABS0L5P3_9BACT|nr:glycoside hydrolase family 76 protein [Hymenobacter guriensis]MBG8555451.1 glycosyl hydrolase [Hymenobacter guriensis]